MANSKYEYVKKFEKDDSLLPECWIAIRLDGRGFTQFCEVHEFEKPNDLRGLQLMDAAAIQVMKEYGDVILCYGTSDEYSFILKKSTQLYGRRAFKLVSVFASLFAASYVMSWSKFFPDKQLQRTPMFDGRATLFPSIQTLRDYLSWRQVDTHINNQYNTCFWSMVKSGTPKQEAQETLAGTQTDFKNELLFSTYGINYNELPERYKKGSVIIRDKQQVASKSADNEKTVVRERRVPVVVHEDIIKDDFWIQHPELLLP